MKELFSIQEEGALDSQIFLNTSKVNLKTI